MSRFKYAKKKALVGTGNDSFQIHAMADFSLGGKLALVTGSSCGLGPEIAKALAAAGAVVLVNGRQIGPLENAVAQIAALGGSAVGLQVDNWTPRFTRCDCGLMR